MASSYELITQIQHALGPVGDRALADRIYTELRADDRIYWDNARGLVLRDGVDLFAMTLPSLRTAARDLPPPIGGALDAAPIEPLWPVGGLPEALL